VLEQKSAGNRTKEEDDYLRSVVTDMKGRLAKIEAGQG
jgi:hypothetical protein